MFIKSQCREILIDTNFITVGAEVDCKNSVFTIKENRLILLGEYKSNERAKEVLDMICDSIEDGMELIEEDSKSDQSVIRNCIFEMPIR